MKISISVCAVAFTLDITFTFTMHLYTRGRTLGRSLGRTLGRSLGRTLGRMKRTPPTGASNQLTQWQGDLTSSTYWFVKKIAPRVLLGSINYRRRAQGRRRRL